MSTESSLAKSKVADTKQGPKESFYEKYMELIVGGIAVLIFLAIWEWIGTSGIVNPTFTSAPSAIWKAFMKMLGNGTLGRDLAVSGYEFIVGYGLAIVIGVPLGVAVGWFRFSHALFNPFIMGLYASPRIALMPLMIIWLGIGLWSKVAIIFLGAIFPLIINMQTAMRTLDPNLLKAADSFGASRWNVFKTIAMPASVPYLISGLRLALGHSLIGIVVGEMFASVAGIGHRVAIAGDTFQTDIVFVGIFILAIAGISLNSLFLSIEHRFNAWRPE